MRRLLAAWLLVLAPLGALAQAPPTLGDLAAAGAAAAQAAGLRADSPAVADRLDEAVATLSAPGVAQAPLTRLPDPCGSFDAVVVARRGQDAYRLDAAEPRDPAVVNAVNLVVSVASNEIVGLAGDAYPEDLEALVQRVQCEQQATGLAGDLETLRRLERKYGPGSARLNLAEVGLAYLLQGVPAFGVGADRRPGPLEAVLAYVPGYLSRSDERMRLMGVLEVGLRHYIFTPGWGEGSGLAGWLKPAYLSYGLAATGASDEPLTAPWRGRTRLGAFFGWGAVKVAWIGGDDQRLLVTQQFQLIPWVF